MSRHALYWEDLVVGDVLVMGSHTFSAEEIIAFAREYDPQPFHVDAQAAQASFFGGLIASGWHTCAVGMRLAVDSYINASASLGSPGVDAIRWPRPVRPGDTITYLRTILASRASKSRPDVGLVQVRLEGRNQRGETVMTNEGWGMFGRRPKPA